jgi:hypothetical protein
MVERKMKPKRKMTARRSTSSFSDEQLLAMLQGRPSMTSSQIAFSTSSLNTTVSFALWRYCLRAETSGGGKL